MHRYQQQLIKAYTPYAVRLALNGRRRPYDVTLDRKQAAILGLVEAATRFDPAKGTNFSKYAKGFILHELQEDKSLYCCSLDKIPESRVSVHQARTDDFLFFELSTLLTRLELDIILLKYYYGYSAEEIAGYLGYETRTIYNKVYILKNKLKEGWIGV